MSFLSATFAALFGRLGLEKYVIPVVETPTGDAKNLQGNADGALLVDISGLAEGDLATTAKQDTGNASLASIDGKVATAAKQDTQTTALGNILTAIQLNATESSLASLLSEVRDLATEASLSSLLSESRTFKVEAPGPQMTTLRDMNFHAANTEPPVDGGAWVSVPGASYAGFLELRLAITGVTGAPAPTQVRMKVWTRLGATGAIAKVYDKTFPVSQLTLPIETNPYGIIFIPVSAPDVLVTFTFPDGTDGTISGLVTGRMVAVAKDQEFPIDPATGYPVVQTKGYDSATDTQKTSDSTQPCDRFLNEPLTVNEATKAIGTHYGPSDSGLIVGEHGEVSVSFSVTGANGGTVTITVEATNQETWASPIDITKSVWESKAGALITAGSIATAANGTQTGILCLGVGSSPCNYRMIRVKYVVAGGASGAISMSFRRKVRS